MSASRLNARSTRRIARSTGLNVIRAWSDGGYTMSFVTGDHVHGRWNKVSEKWVTFENPVIHFATCADLFGAENCPGYRPAPDWDGTYPIAERSD